ncbi:MAG TPA: hypothetical protein VJR06_05745, partial [Nitrososphaerales archaeon]|nr:hypothetical protein [Nitrososphaerales archaeon]
TRSTARTSRSAASEVLSRRRLLLVLAVLLVEIGLFFVGLLTPLSDATRQTLINQTSSQFGEVQTGSTVQLVGFIFAHNLFIALAEMIPVAGALLFAVSVFSTGLAAQALVASQGLPAQWGAVIFAFPYALVELTAYAVALASGFMLLSAWRRGRLRRELKVFALEGAAVFVILFIAAAMEAATVKISFILGFALWLPTGLALAVIMVMAGRRPR